MKRLKYGVIGTAGIFAGALGMLASQAFGASTTAGTLALQAGNNLGISCPNALTNAAVKTKSETVQCATNVVTPPPTTTPPPPTTIATPPPTTTPPPTDPPTTTGSSGSWACVTSDSHGHCPFPSDSQITGPVDTPYVDQNVWSPTGNWSQTLSANSLQDWQVVANMPKGNTGVISFPNAGVTLHDPVDSFTTTTASFSETMPHNAQTSGWGMFDLWYNNWADEVMVQFDFSNNGDCDSVASATFDGQAWHLCDFGGGTMALKLGADEAHKGQENGGTFDLLAMSKWLESTGYLPAGSTWTAISEGWEICSTGSQPETFSNSGFTLTMS